MISDFEKHTAPVTYTKEEIKEKLKCYISVDRDRFDTLEFNSHVRYFKKSGEFKCGGFVYINPKVTKEGHQYMLLKSDKFRSKGVVIWTLYYDDIEKLYVKTGVDYHMATTQLNRRDKELQDAFDKIAIYIKKIYTRLKKLEQSSDDTKSNATRMSDFMIHKMTMDVDNISIPE